MANPFTYLELHSTDPAKAKRFYSELFGWQTKDTDVPGFGTYTEIDIGEGPGAGLMAQPDPSARSAWLAYVLVPTYAYPAIRQCAVVIAKSPNKTEAHAFLDWLRTSAVQDTLHNLGLAPVR